MAENEGLRFSFLRSVWGRAWYIGMNETCRAGFEKVSERRETVLMVRVHSRYSTIGSGRDG